MRDACDTRLMRIARCDQCGKDEDLARYNEVPHGWFYVHQEFDRDFRDRYWSFCSQGCLATFFFGQTLPAPVAGDDD